MALAVPGVLNGDGARNHGDDTPAACILLSLRRTERITLDVQAASAGDYKHSILHTHQQDFQETFSQQLKRECKKSHD